MKQFIYTVLAFSLLISCSKTTDDAIEPNSDVKATFAVQTLTDFEGIEGFDVTGIRSMVFDSKDNLYFTTDGSINVFKMTPDGSMSTLPYSSNEIFKYDSPSRLFLGANDELCITGLYQKSDVLYFSYKEGGEIEAVPNPFAGPDDFYSLISFMTSDADGNNILGYNTSVYRQNGDEWVEIAQEVELNGHGLEGNIFSTGGGRSYYKLTGFEGIFNDAVLAYLDTDFQKHYIQSDSFYPGDETTYDYGDGTVPNVFVGNVSVLTSDKQGNFYFLDEYKLTGRVRLRRLSLDGKLSTLAGGVLADSNTDGIGSDASFIYAFTMAINSKGEIYIGTSDGLRLATESTSN
ncbi:hypothetical protein [uncultured Arcticibacterium sp.]|uniref:hypothetical protein n=1 Tax=uncultured Arcticibacterium sp. TaxID=2173042 RepID=UPI0030FB056C